MEAGARPDALQAWTELSELLAVTRTALNRALHQQAGMSLAENLVLCQVAMAPNRRLRMVDLADLLTIGKSAVTKTVDRLEDRGWVSRERDAADRRIVYATLSHDGARAFDRAQPVFAQTVQTSVGDPLNVDELAALRATLRKIRHGIAADTNQ
jgi:DNA-binding MarR family transcriptional regulator